MKHDKVVVIGGGETVGSVARMLAHKLENVLVNPAFEPEPKTFVIKNRPRLPEVYLVYFPYPTELVRNYKKHKRTCEKNRKNRKRKR